MMGKKQDKRICPGCGKPLTSDFPFCYSCCRFLTRDRCKIRSPQKVTQEELEKLLKISENVSWSRWEQFLRILSVCMVIGTIAAFSVGVYMLKTDYFWLSMGLIFGSVILLPVACVIYPESPVELDQMQLDRLGAAYVMPSGVRKVLGSSAYYDPDKDLPEDYIREAGLFDSVYETYQGGQYIKTCRNHVPIEMGRVHLTKTRYKNFSKVEVFDGYCLRAETNLSIPTEIRLIEKTFGCLYSGQDNGEPAEFGLVFKMNCGDPQKADAFLTSERKDHIIQALQETKGIFHILFKTDGSILIASQEYESVFSDREHPEQWQAECEQALAGPLKMLDLILQ